MTVIILPTAEKNKLTNALELLRCIVKEGVFKSVFGPAERSSFKVLIAEFEKLENEVKILNSKLIDAQIIKDGLYTKIQQLELVRGQK